MDFRRSGENNAFKYEWIIQNLCHSFKNNGHHRVSSPFRVGKTKWTLSMFSMPDSDRIDLCIARDADCQGPDSLTLEFRCEVGNDLTKNTAHKLVFDFKRGETYDCVGFDKKEYAPISPADIVTVFFWMKAVNAFEDVGYCLARTVIEVKRVTLNWEISNFSALEPGMDTTLSIKSSEHCTQATTIIRLFLKSGSDDDKKMIILQFESCDDQMNSCDFRLSLLHTGGFTIECCREELLRDDRCKVKNRSLFLSKERLMAQKDLYLPNDTLTLKCECAFATGFALNKVEKVCPGSNPHQGRTPTATTHLQSVTKRSPHLRSALQDFKSLYNDLSFCDVKLQVNNTTFLAHKSVLSTRSPVFEAMFRTDMKENSEGCVHIGDVNDDTVRRMLEYLYTASITDVNDWESALELYEAADKYQILSLKEKCSEALKSHLRISNVLRIFVLSDMHCDEGLKSAVHDFFLSNHKDIMNSTEWADLMTSIASQAGCGNDA